MTLETAQKLLQENHQEQILRFWDRLDANERNALLAQIETFDFAAINRMRALLKAAPQDTPRHECPPAPVEELSGAARAQAAAHGRDLIKAGRAGVLLVAGGQGSRLGFDGPKGAYPVGPIKDRTLFFYHARKVLALDKAYGVRIPFYIMTSETNDEATREHFRQNGFFGLPEEDVFFFVQGMWPALDPEGKIILDRPGHVFMSPDGHGGTLSALAASGAIEDMEKRGVDTLFFFQVDNPMVEICDPAFLGLHDLRGADISIKVCAKREPSEGLGIVVKRADGRYGMVEYSELTPEQMNRRTISGALYYRFGSVAIHVFSRAFLKREALGEMPLHIAHKKIPYCAEDGSTVKPEKPNACKFEKFIFDVLPDAQTVVNLAFDRNEEFSPVKNAEGKDSPESCRMDLMAKWMRRLREASRELPPMPFGIDPVHPLTPERD
ncbi:MAG: UDPGP type 1 family protein [Kiritimatiellia bacterium]|nr:UDPGP type 1 family protein [Kiritimatiellia bacterium]